MTRVVAQNLHEECATGAGSRRHHFQRQGGGAETHRHVVPVLTLIARPPTRRAQGRLAMRPGRGHVGRRKKYRRHQWRPACASCGRPSDVGPICRHCIDAKRDGSHRSHPRYAARRIRSVVSGGLPEHWKRR
jgi:hypothetical protein